MIGRLIGRELGLPFSFERERVSTAPLADLLPILSHQGVYLIVGMVPLEERLILEIDPFLAQMAIDKLLGGDGGPLMMIRPLTEIEEGVFSYLFLKILAEIFERSGRAAHLHFRLDGFQSSPPAIASRLPEGQKKGSAVVISFRLTLGKRAGYARLILPASFVEQKSTELMGETNLSYKVARLANFGFVKTELWGEVGRTTLKGSEVNHLEPGDLLILEKTAAHVDPASGRLAGAVAIRLGRGETGSFRASILPEGGTGKGRSPLRFKLEGVDRDCSLG